MSDSVKRAPYNASFSFMSPYNKFRAGYMLIILLAKLDVVDKDQVDKFVIDLDRNLDLKAFRL